MKKTLWIFTTIICLAIQLGWAQPPGKHQNQPHQPHLRQGFFPPEMVMQNQEKIGLTSAQQQYLSKEMQTAQANFNKVQWSLHREMEKMHQLTQQAKVNEAVVLQQLEKILTLERQIKRQQLTLMIRIKNNLTAKQQDILKKLAPKHRDRR